MINFLTNILSVRVCADMTKRVAIYTRVSTADGQQTIDNQLRDLHLAAERMGWEIVAHYSDEGISGAKGRDGRAGLDAMLKAITRREFDMVAAWSVCRLGRSLQHLVSLLGDLDARGVDLYLHVQALDTSTPSGKAMFQMLGVFSEFERAMISERVRAGLRRSAKRGGRPALDIERHQRIERLLKDGLSINKTAKEVRVGVATVHRIKTSMVADAQCESSSVTRTHYG